MARMTVRQLLKLAQQQDRAVSVQVGESTVYGASGTLHVKRVKPGEVTLTSRRGAQIILDPKQIRRVNLFGEAS